VDPDALRLRLADAAADTPLESLERSGDHPAAVLVPLIEAPGSRAPAGGDTGRRRWYLLLIRRTEALAIHGGEIAFPGGRVEPGEDSLAAALRETEEELAVTAADVTILGRLPDVETRVSRYRITPWVGVVAGAVRQRMRPQPAEVAGVLEIALDEIADPACRREQRFIRGPAMILSPAYDVGGVTVWGATARIVSELLDRLPAEVHRGPAAIR